MLVVAMLPPLSPVSMLATPSIVMLLEFGRWPLTVKPLTDPISLPPVFCDSAPGTSVAKLKSMRPLLAMFFSASLSSVNERSPLVDLQLGDAARDADFLRHRADFQRERAGRELVVRVHDDVGPLERLEALQRDLERVGVGTDDGEDEAAALVGHRGEGVALRAAGQRDRDARQHPALRVLDGAGDGCARRLRAGRTAGYPRRPRLSRASPEPVAEPSAKDMDYSSLPRLHRIDSCDSNHATLIRRPRTSVRHIDRDRELSVVVQSSATSRSAASTASAVPGRRHVGFRCRRRSSTPRPPRSRPALRWILASVT